MLSSIHLFISLGMLFGLVLGSFGNSVVYRLPRKLLLEWRQGAQEELGLPVDDDAPMLRAKRSHCPACGVRIAWYDNLPVVSWLLLRGKCRACHRLISPRYLALELAGAATGAGSVAWLGFTAQAALVGVAALLLLWAAVIDIEHQLLPDALVHPLAALGLVAATQSWFISPTLAIYGALAGYGLLGVTGAAFKAWRGVDGIGGGDAWLLLAIGTFVGPFGVVQTLATACPLALFAALAANRQKLDGQVRLAFGQWLALGGVIIFALQRSGRLPIPYAAFG
ncbi:MULTISPECIES: prepilin peptidase [unclassified Variovorax]|uniref:prepilin peptidase n=1 Tax=unclassified Variovorax TaxID=663243 RepID=UPI001315E819|nr:MULTISPECIES: A24 family peptidase [unclassified Variovorax]VTU42807.1 Pectic enzymes secretion protein OutO [Variovorax sp. PBL-H6]VTU43665.1 Pectic enzymes secretion protein OutO [Variovorax sp. SRS16]VTU43728.1 Pectic enzymes secretion protein OutO [Variovorax sp. PBL-E5]